MQGHQKGVAVKIKEVAPLSVNVYCAAHGSNLVMKTSCRSSVNGVNLYGTDSKPGELQRLRTFIYGNARKRKDIYSRNKSELPGLANKDLQATHNVRFNAAHGAAERCIELIYPVLNCLREIVDPGSGFDSAVRCEVSELMKTFSSYETLLTLHAFKGLESLE